MKENQDDIGKKIIRIRPSSLQQRGIQSGSAKGRLNEVVPNGWVPAHGGEIGIYVVVGTILEVVTT